MKRIIPLYLIREMLPPFFLNIIVFTFILLMAKVLELTELVVVKGVSPWTILSLLSLSLPYFISLTIPMATLLAVLLAFLRLTGDNEVTVLKSAGVSLYQLLSPVLLFCLWTYLLTSWLTLILVPAANQSFKNELLALAKARADVGIKERVFNRSFQDILLYVNHIPLGSDTMEDLFIQDSRDPEVSSVIVASRGRIATDSEKRALIFQLFNGVIDRLHKERDTTETITFDKYELKLKIGGVGGEGNLMQRDQYEMNLDELWRVVDELKLKNDPKYPSYLMEAHRRLALPVACIILGLIAVPLGVRYRVRGTNWGLVMGMVIFLFYYLFMTLAHSFGDTGLYPPVLGVWAPNIIIGLAAVYMIVKANNEKPFFRFDWLTRLMRRTSDRHEGGSA